MAAPILCGENAFAVVSAIPRQRRKPNYLDCSFVLGEELQSLSTFVCSQNTSII